MCCHSVPHWNKPTQSWSRWCTVPRGLAGVRTKGRTEVWSVRQIFTRPLAGVCGWGETGVISHSFPSLKTNTILSLARPLRFSNTSQVVEACYTLPEARRRGGKTSIPPPAAHKAPGRGSDRRRSARYVQGRVAGAAHYWHTPRRWCSTPMAAHANPAASIPWTPLVPFMNNTANIQTTWACDCGDGVFTQSCLRFHPLVSQARLDPTREDRGGLTPKGFQSKTGPRRQQQQLDQPVKGRQVCTSWPAGQQMAPGVTSTRASGVLEEPGPR